MKQAMRRVLCLGFALLLFLGRPQAVRAQDAPPDVGAEAYVVMDAQTGQVLVAKNADVAQYPASITKILTLGLALEACGSDMDAMAMPVEVSYNATHSLIPRAASVALTEGEQVLFSDLLFATHICSANDAANVLAEHVGGSIEDFAALMNRKAAELGLSASHHALGAGGAGVP